MNFTLNKKILQLIKVEVDKNIKNETKKLQSLYDNLNNSSLGGV